MKQVMYIGPDIRGIVRKNQIFTYEPKEVIEKAAAINASARLFFVPMDEIVESKNELRRQGSFLNITYKNFEKTIMRR